MTLTTGATTLSEAFNDVCAMQGTLNERLKAYSDKLRELNFPFAEAYDALVARLNAGEVGRSTPDVGELMPPFMLPSKANIVVALEDLTAKGPVVILLNRGHWCPFCKVQLRTIAEYHETISALGASIVSIMPDRQQFVEDLRNVTDHKIEILSDMDSGYALSLGLVMWLGDQLQSLMLGRGFSLEGFQGSNGWFVPVPATFIVDRSGMIVAREIDTEFRQRMEISAIIEALRACQS